jgi:hypothetical protein
VKLQAQPHRHRYTVMGHDADRRLPEVMGYDAEILRGCRGLAGNFGMENGHYEILQTIMSRGNPQAG